MRLKNNIDYKRFPEPYRGDWGRFTILVLSAEMPCRTLCKAFLVKSIPKNIPKTRKVAHKKSLAVGQLFAKERGLAIIKISPTIDHQILFPAVCFQ